MEATPLPSISVAGHLETLPWGCYLMRGSLDSEAQEALARRVGALARSTFKECGGWVKIACSQRHPMIVASHSAGATRPNECVRACGLTRCTGACGRHVGALPSPPEDLYALARDVVRAMEVQHPGACPDFQPSHCWALVYGPGEKCGRMQSHLDRPVGWTLSISVGVSAKFTVGCPPDPGSMYANYARHLPLPGQGPPGVSFELHGGDAMLFRGHRVFHSVDGMVERAADESPSPGSGWVEGLLAGNQLLADYGPSGWRPLRLALLFRDQNERE